MFFVYAVFVRDCTSVSAQSVCVNDLSTGTVFY